MSGPAVIAKLTSKPGGREVLTDVLRRIVAGTEHEPGTLTYRLHHDAKDHDTKDHDTKDHDTKDHDTKDHDTKDHDVVWFYEHYESDDAFNAHGSSDTMVATAPELGPLLAGRPQLTFLTLVTGKGL